MSNSSLRNSRLLRNSVLGTVVCGVAITAGSMMGITSSPDPEGMPVPDSNTEPEEVISALDSDSSVEVEDLNLDAAEYVTDLSSHGVSGIDESTLVELGTSDGVRYWVGTDSVSNICLVTYLEDTEYIGSACNTPEAVEQFGIYLGALHNSEAEEKAVTSVLLPDSAAVDSQVELSNSRMAAADGGVDTDQNPWSQISPNVVTTHTDEVKTPASFTFPRSDSRNADDLTVEIQQSPDDDVSPEDLKE